MSTIQRPKDYVLHQLEREVKRSKRLIEDWKKFPTGTAMNPEDAIKWWTDVLEMLEYTVKMIKERDMTLDEIFQENGFDGEKEFHKLVASVDISTYERVVRFTTWRDKDATKDGLLKVIEENGTKSVLNDKGIFTAGAVVLILLLSLLFFGAWQGFVWWNDKHDGHHSSQQNQIEDVNKSHSVSE